MGAAGPASGLRTSGKGLTGPVHTSATENAGTDEARPPPILPVAGAEVEMITAFGNHQPVTTTSAAYAGAGPQREGGRKCPGGGYVSSSQRPWAGGRKSHEHTSRVFRSLRPLDMLLTLGNLKAKSAAACESRASQWPDGHGPSRELPTVEGPGG